jgi:hypothetical protein
MKKNGWLCMYIDICCFSYIQLTILCWIWAHKVASETFFTLQFVSFEWEHSNYTIKFTDLSYNVESRKFVILIWFFLLQSRLAKNLINLTYFKTAINICSLANHFTHNFHFILCIYIQFLINYYLQM